MVIGCHFMQPLLKLSKSF